MNDPQVRFEQLIAKLKERQYRITPQRVELIRLIAASEGHPSASQLYNQIKVQFPTMSLATVYKTLDLLKEVGEVLEIGLRDDSHYDGNKPYPHPHLICMKCQKIMDGELDAAVGKIVQEVENNFGFRVVKHQLDFYGLCPDCQKKSK
ncbi:Fur family transcriptional regulator [Candidatus Villigracilis affinis]|jgi:Fur family peroxide stress response transcriptional regulator|uniref:Fur family transcriptional regulator n=1 Tax=Candidatus Villigracilis affinis TaxID=3140682 RepID=UPI001D67A858|nr:transcriptional repressor [Anaerolineales bacterium]